LSEETTQPREEATGKFVPSTEGLYGRELANAEAGFTTKKDKPTDEKTYSDTLEGVQEAGRDLALKRANATAPAEIDVDAVKEQLGKPPLNEARTAEQAARELSSMRADVSKYVDGINLLGVGEEVDKLRAEALKNNPSAAKDLGLSDEDVAAAKKADGESKEAEPKQTKVRPDPIDGEPVQGLDPEVEKALKHPQVRAAIQEELGKAEQSQQQYAAAVNTANTYAQASLIDAIPELSQVPIENWQAALTLLHQNGDGRVARAMSIIQRVSDLSAAQMQLQQHQAQEQQRQYQQQFQSWKTQQDAIYRTKSQIPEAESRRFSKLAVEYFGSLGVTESEIRSLMQTQPIMHSAAFALVLEDAVQYRETQKAKAKISAQPLPPVQRPGTPGTRSAAADNSAKIASLQKQLATAPGDRAMRIAAQIRNARRSA
jgi:hypothetical protein